MNKYRIRYIKDAFGVEIVEADSFNGIEKTCDTYTFKKEGQIVAAMPKSAVVSVEKINGSEDE